MSTSNRENLKDESEGEEEQNKKKEDKADHKLPFDMKIFWKNIDDKYFKNLDQFGVNEVNHLVHLYSKYGKLFYIIQIQTMTTFIVKLGFPGLLTAF
jgi:hypothetical protein